MSANGINVKATKALQTLKDTDYVIVGSDKMEKPLKVSVVDFKEKFLATPENPTTGDALIFDGENWVAGSAGGGDEELTAIVDISSAEILAMGDTPIELLEAPGEGMYYDFVDITLEYTHVNTAYTLADALLYTNGAHYQTFSSFFIKGTANIFIKLTGGSYSDVDGVESTLSASLIELNTALELKTYFNTNPTLGDGTIRAIIRYKVRTFGA